MSVANGVERAGCSSRDLVAVALGPAPQQVLVFAHPVAVAADVDDVAVVQEAVDERGRHDLVAEGGAPLLEALFDVSTVEARSWRALMSWKNSVAPSWLTGR